MSRLNFEYGMDACLTLGMDGEVLALLLRGNNMDQTEIRPEQLL